jgi:SAM-dependent methyltransferase
MPPRVDELEAAVHQLGIQSGHKNLDHVGAHNWRAGLFVDFSGWYLDQAAIDALVDSIRELAKVKHGRGAGGYQQVSDLGVPGNRPDNRDLPSAVADLAADSTVLDIGCNLAHFSRMASAAGASRVMGVEKDATVVWLAMTINALLGYWNIDVVQGKLPQDLPALSSLDFDLIICLSAVKYIGDLAAPAWLSTLAPNLWLEGHGDVPAEYYAETLGRAYPQVARLPDATDLKTRAQFLCSTDVLP